MTTTAPETTDDWGPNPEEVRIAPQRLRAGGDGSLVINVDLPAGYHLNPLAPQRYRVGFEAETMTLTLDRQAANGSGKDLRFPVRVPLRATAAGSAKLLVQPPTFT